MCCSALATGNDAVMSIKVFGGEVIGTREAGREDENGRMETGNSEIARAGAKLIWVKNKGSNSEVSHKMIFQFSFARQNEYDGAGRETGGSSIHLPKNKVRLCLSSYNQQELMKRKPAQTF